MFLSRNRILRIKKKRKTIRNKRKNKDVRTRAHTHTMGFLYLYKYTIVSIYIEQREIRNTFRNAGICIFISYYIMRLIIIYYLFIVIRNLHCNTRTMFFLIII